MYLLPFSLKKAKDTEITQLSLEVAQAKSNLQLSVNKITLAQKKITELEQSLKESKVSFTFDFYGSSLFAHF